MARPGAPTGSGRGGSGQKLDAEFSDTNFGRGTVGMARAQSPDSGDSQFFICFKDCSFLNGQYTVWGPVTDAMELVDGIKSGEPTRDPAQTVKMPGRAGTKKTQSPGNSTEERRE